MKYYLQIHYRINDVLSFFASVVFIYDWPWRDHVTYKQPFPKARGRSVVSNSCWSELLLFRFIPFVGVRVDT